MQHDVKDHILIVKAPQPPNSTSQQKLFILFLFSLFIFQFSTLNDLSSVTGPQKGQGFEVMFFKASQHMKCFYSYLAERLTATVKLYNYAICRWFKYSMSGFSDMEVVRAKM